MRSPERAAAIAAADAAWERWWESEGTLFPDLSLLEAAKEAERRFEAVFWREWRSQ